MKKYNLGNLVIISLTSNINNINLVHKVIYSILEQNVDESFYRIPLILSKKEFIKKPIPNEILFLAKLKKLRLY